MTKAQALKTFFSGFGMDAYPVTAVPKNAELPYLTYETPLGSWGDGEMGCTVQMWFRTTSESIPNAKVELISKTLGFGGKQIRCEGGTIWIKKGSPFSVTYSPEIDNTLKLRQLNLTLEYFTF